MCQGCNAPQQIAAAYLIQRQARRRERIAYAYGAAGWITAMITAAFAF